MDWLRVLSALAVSCAMASYGLARNSLNYSGALSAFIVGIVAVIAGYRFGVVLIAFFLSSSWLTKYKADAKAKVEDDHQPGGARNWKQVFANAFTGSVICVAYVYFSRFSFPVDVHVHFQRHPIQSFIVAAYLGHYACCNGDTWASELGILSKSQPWLITTFQIVPTGTNGGISLLGTSASVLGGAFIGLVFYLAGFIFVAHSADDPSQLSLLFLGAFAGLFGSLLDSLLGATLQYSGFCSVKKKVVSYSGPSVRHVSGINVLSNHEVNFLSSMITSVVTAVVAYRFLP